MSDQHHQDFQCLFADGSRTAKQRPNMVSSGDESSAGSEYWSGDGKDDWTVDFGGPLTYKPEVEKPPPKSIYFDEFYGKKYESNKRIAKNAQASTGIGKASKKARKEKEKEEKRLKLEKEQKEKLELLMLIHEQDRLNKETNAKKRRK